MADAAVAAPGTSRRGLAGFLFHHEVEEYPEGGRRIGYLALAVAATIVLYYTYYTQTGVTPNILQSYHMSFSFYVWIVIISNALGAFASLPASKTDALGRANVIIYGLLVVGLLIWFGVPAAHSEWSFAVVICAVGLVEGAILVATPALVRDFSPQLGRASAMGFWTVGPVAGSLIVSIVANHTLNALGTNWTDQFRYSGITSVVLFVVCLFWMKDLSSRLREQLMVSARDRAVLEAKARGISEAEVASATAHPWRQILKGDLFLSSLGIALFLLVYYAAAGFFTIYWATVFHNPNGLNYSTSQANGLNTWFWGADIVALIIVGLVSDRLRVRKPLMLVGAIGSIVVLLVFSHLASNGGTAHSTLVLVSVLLAVFLSVTYAPWMAAYTETVEAKNPALVATGLALWGWVLRLVVAISFIFLPMVVNSVNPVVNNLQFAQPPGAPFNVQEFQIQHPQLVDFATKNASWLKPLSDPKNAAVVAAAHANPTDPAALAALQKAVGAAVVAKIVANLKEVNGPVFQYRTQLGYLSQHQNELLALENGISKSAKQWQDWFWVCLGGMVLFIPTIWLNRGRWSPAKAKADAEEHEAEVEVELEQLAGSPA